MAYFENIVKEQVVSEHTRYPACASLPDLIVLQSQDRAATFISSLDPESRPKPNEPLYLYPTARGGQTITKVSYGKSIKGPYAVGYYPCATPSYATKVDQRYLGMNTPSTPWPEPFGWQTKMRLDIKNLTVNLGISLAEYRQTANMFSSFATGMSKAYRAYRGRYKYRRRLSPCDIAASELTISYGVEPLVNDMYDSVVALTDRLEKPIMRRFVSSSQETINFNEPLLHVHGNLTTSDRAIAYVELDPGASAFTLGNPLELAWEVIPFSFVVDWGIGVGDYLSSLDALKAVTGVTGTVTRRLRGFGFQNDSVLNPGETFTQKGSWDYIDNSRTVLTEIPAPSFPRWDPSKSWRAITHGISLLTTLNKGCSGKGSKPWR